MKPVIQIDEFAKEVLPEKSDFTNPNEEEEKKILMKLVKNVQLVSVKRSRQLTKRTR